MSARNLLACLCEDAMTLLEMLRATAGRVPRRPAFVFRGRRLSYGELLEGSRKVAALLQRLGVERGERIALMLPNAPEFGLGYFCLLYTSDAADE